MSYSTFVDLQLLRLYSSRPLFYFSLHLLISCFHWQWEFNAKLKCPYGFQTSRQQHADGLCNFAVSLSVKSKTDKWGRTRTLLYRSHTSVSVHYLLIGDRCGFMFPLDVHPNICKWEHICFHLFFPLSDQFSFFFFTFDTFVMWIRRKIFSPQFPAWTCQRAVSQALIYSTCYTRLINMTSCCSWMIDACLSC